MSARPSLAEHASALLEGDMDAGEHSPRLACWLARAELEDRVRALLDAKGWPPGDASTRSVLSCFAIAYEDQPVLVAQVTYAWSALSRAAHHHAYELGLTVVEARHLTDLVAGLPTGIGD